jgi:cytochrome d ubiquinol oxidase subunit II
MSTAAFCILAVLLAGYVVLDGYDLGMGSVFFLVAKGEDERRAARASIAPYWNGNEVWLIVAGAALFAFFPQVYAAAFSGFYLPFMFVLWSLIGRGIAFEFRETIEHPLWHAFWDVAFSVSSVLLVVLLGLALGNVVRGVPLERGGYFFGLLGFLLNPYALAVAALAVLALAQHGAAYLFSHTDGPLAQRSAGVASRLFPVVTASYACVTAATFFVRPLDTLGPRPAIALGGAVAAGGLVAVRLALGRGRARAAFAASTCFLIGLLLAAAATTYPYLLPGYPDPRSGLDIVRFAAPPVSLTTALVVIVLGLVLATAYRAFVVSAISRRRDRPSSG